MAVMVVTGASAGIGRAVAELALAEGWQVACLARSLGPLEEVAAKGDGLALACDVSDPAAVEAGFAATVAHFGRIDVLFNNAGMFPPAALPDEVALDDWNACVAVNLTGMFLCARAAFGQMRRQDPQGGRIINNGSISGQVPRPRSLAYTTTKHAINGMTKQLALDGRGFGIAAGQIDVGNAATGLLAGIDGSATKGAEPVMEVANVARAVMHMASLPPGANVLQMTVMATEMPFVGRG
ncbi:SDR family oxidoreductase [Pseudothioclava arenosa]|uniref:Short-chain dehydrogenase n=1 Tax=Pseudothioclava arenosa TaxID=1795308 RepID=A0A2A4CRB5_9RHOB|nr:SDR family oxidoreductase [Pseudothioclava arenosa]PCD77781.1 short-chain dehydrogenase [Pseudothioclava arenosa]